MRRCKSRQLENGRERENEKNESEKWRKERTRKKEQKEGRALGVKTEDEKKKIEN